MQKRVDAALRQLGLNVTGEQVLGGPFPFKKGIQMTDSEAAHEARQLAAFHFSGTPIRVVAAEPAWSHVRVRRYP